MPFIRILPSEPLSGGRAPTGLLAEVTRVAAECLGKPESVMMARFEPAAPMWLAGSADPCCYIDVHLIGPLAPEVARDLNTALCRTAEAHLGIPTDRTFVVFTDVPRSLWGVRGRMLG